MGKLTYVINRLEMGLRGEQPNLAVLQRRDHSQVIEDLVYVCMYVFILGKKVPFWTLGVKIELL
jgi:hypothetical protein